ncbi:hypothetical protein AO411_2022035 [Salmonella enterica subsp. enterica serovar Sarajane]|nr:hypothetical protein AO411_2022035 [Salmonella enterica subsp. enterica serovar Sarajane]
MQNIIQRVFKAKKATQKLHGITEGTIWRTATDDPDEDDARDTLAIKEAGFKRSDFFKPVRVDHLVVDDMPAEGVFDTAFCDRYKLAEDGKSWLLPAAQPNPAGTDTNNQEQGNENTTNITDSGDTASAASAAVTDSETTADTATSASDKADADSVNDVNVNGEPMNEVEKGMDWPMKDLPLPVRWMAQKGMGSKVLFLRPAERERLTKILEAEGWNNNQHLINIKEVTASEIAPEIDKLTPHHLHRLVTAFDKVSEKVERMGPFMAKRFVRAWLDTEYIDQGILVNEWCAGRHVSRIEKSGTTNAGASATPEPQKTSATKANATASGKPAAKTAYKTIDTRIGIALTKGEITFPITARVVEQGKAIVEADGEEFKQWSATYRITENIQFYDERTHIEMIRQAPREVVTGSPELRRAYVDNYLSAYGTLDPEQMVFMPKQPPAEHEENQARVRKAGKNLRDIAAGRFNCNEEEIQPTDTLADEPPAPETVEPDTTKHYQDPQQVETESSVSVVDDGEQALREKFGEQLAAERGDFVPGISDPSDPKWVHNDYSANASNEGEKTEVATDRTEDTADEADHSEEFSNQTGPETNHSESSTDSTDSTDHNEAETPETPETPETSETGPKSQQPEPVTKVADGVFDASDVSAFLRTSQVPQIRLKKAEIPEPDNDERSSDCGDNERRGRQERQERKGDDTCQTEIMHLLKAISEDLKKIDARQARAERQRKRMMAAVCMMATTLTEEETEGDNNHDN